MTEAFKRFVEQNHKGPTPKYAADDAYYWIRVFCEEVEKRASAENTRREGRQNYNDLIADALEQLKREWLDLPTP